jgi:hypothetical protein
MSHIACAIVFATITWSVEHSPEGTFKGCPWLALMVLSMWFGSFLGAVIP